VVEFKFRLNAIPSLSTDGGVRGRRRPFAVATEGE
jgi:hypothetical protein